MNFEVYLLRSLFSSSSVDLKILAYPNHPLYPQASAWRQQAQILENKILQNNLRFDDVVRDIPEINHKHVLLISTAVRLIYDNTGVLPVITSWWRPNWLNEFIASQDYPASPTSLHLTARAADLSFTCRRQDGKVINLNRFFFNLIMNFATANQMHGLILLTSDSSLTKPSEDFLHLGFEDAKGMRVGSEDRISPASLLYISPVTYRLDGYCGPHWFNQYIKRSLTSPPPPSFVFTQLARLSGDMSSRLIVPSQVRPDDTRPTFYVGVRSPFSDTFRLPFYVGSEPDGRGGRRYHVGVQEPGALGVRSPVIAKKEYDVSTASDYAWAGKDPDGVYRDRSQSSEFDIDPEDGSYPKTWVTNSQTQSAVSTTPDAQVPLELPLSDDPEAESQFYTSESSDSQESEAPVAPRNSNHLIGRSFYEED